MYNGTDVPTLTVSLTARIELPRSTVERLPSLDVVPDFIDGWAFGDTVGIFLRNYSPGRWVIDSVSLTSEQVNDFSWW